MNINRRIFSSWTLASFSALATLSSQTQAQSPSSAPTPGAGQGSAYPTKPIRIVVPFGAGGVADLTVRAVGQKLSEQIGQAVVIDNKPGAGGIAAADAVIKAEPDGHTLLLMSNGTAVSAGLFKALPYDPVKDFAPISTLGYFDIAILAVANAPLRNMADVMAAAKREPGKLNVGTINIGSTQHLAAELFKARSGLDFQIVPFNGTPALTTALRGNQIDIAIEILGPMMGQIKGGAVRALAVMGDSRATQLADVPTLAQAGLSGFDVSSWNALAAPARTPKDIVQRLQRELQTVLATPDIRRRLADLEVEARSSTPEQLAALLAQDIKRWSEVIQKAGVPRL